MAVNFLLHSVILGKMVKTAYTPMPITEHQLQQTTRIAARLRQIGAQSPGAIAFTVNPGMIDSILTGLSALGMKKGFFKARYQFVPEAFFGSEPAAIFLMRGCFITGDLDQNGHLHCWNGAGGYAGTQGAIQSINFNSPDKANCSLAIHCRDCIGLLADLLDPVPGATPTAQEKRFVDAAFTSGR